MSCSCEQRRENGYDSGEGKWRLSHITAPKIVTISGARPHIPPPCMKTLHISDVKTPPHPPWAWASEPSKERHHRARMAIVYMLCNAGVDVNGRDACGLTPLHYAARRGQSREWLY